MKHRPHSHRTHRRSGVSLLELLAVVTLMGILSTVIVSRVGRSFVGDINSQGDAHRVWLDMQYARRLAIKNGQASCVVFNAAPANSYRVMLGTAVEVATGRATQMGDARVFGSDMTVSPSATVFEFSFEGHASANYSVLMTAPDQRWQVSVVPLSGLATVQKL